MGLKSRIFIIVDSCKMVCNFSSALPASKAWRRIIIFLAMFFGLVSVGAIAYYYMVVSNDYLVIACIATLGPTLIIGVGTYCYLLVNYQPKQVLPTQQLEIPPASQQVKTAMKKKVLLYLLFGFMLGVPAIYVIMSGVKQNIFTISFPVVYIIGMSVASIAFLPGFLRSTGAIAPVRWFVLLVTLTIIILKVGIYLNSYFPGNLSHSIAENLFFSLGVANWLLILMLDASWHQVFTIEVPVSVPLNKLQTTVEIVHTDECKCTKCKDPRVSDGMLRSPLTIPSLNPLASNVRSPSDSLGVNVMAL